MLLELLKNPANEMCQDYIFKCLHALIEKQDEYSNESVENRKISIKRKLTPETLDIIISLLINKKLRFKEKNDQKNEIFQTLLSFCQDSHNFEIFSINTLEKLAVNINKELEIILNDLCAYKKQIGLDKVIGFDKKIDHENVKKILIKFYKKIFKCKIFSLSMLFAMKSLRNMKNYTI